jgi:hypothetical protein
VALNKKNGSIMPSYYYYHYYHYPIAEACKVTRNTVFSFKLVLVDSLTLINATINTCQFYSVP